MAKRIVFLVGPTASGKSEVAVRLAARINAEIISCDSMQIYKGMDIITSKPSYALRKKVRHHLISVVLPTQDYDVARYRRDALKKVKEIIKKSRVPLFVGGTGFYMSILIDGIFKAKAADASVRSLLSKTAQEKGSAFLHNRLKAVDPQAAGRIHPNDTKRIIRALEVYEINGRPISQLQIERRGLGAEYEVRIFCLQMDRESLYARIEARLEWMFRQGLLEEVRRLLKLRLSRTVQYAIGIEECKEYLGGRTSLDEVKRLMKQKTRNYAKRQLTWFRKDKRIEWVDVAAAESPASIAKRIALSLKN